MCLKSKEVNMDTKTMKACLQGRLGRHRPTVPNHTMKALACKLALDAQRGQNPGKAKPPKKKKRKKARKGKPPKYSRLSRDKRLLLAELLRLGISKTEIAKRLDCDRATIYREIGRNGGQRGYGVAQAQRRADGRVKVKATARRKLTPAIWKEAKERLEKDGWTFEQTCGRAKRDGRRFVCKETLYKEFYARLRLVLAGKSMEALPKLPRGHRKRHRRCPAKYTREAGRGKIPGRVDIDQRPKAVDSRARAGHWEGDLINGLRGTGNLVTLVERLSRFTLVGYSATKETDAVMKVMADLLAGLPREMVQTLTLDIIGNRALSGISDAA